MIKNKDGAANANEINMQALSFQVRESYKAARTNIAYSIIKKGCKKIVFTSSSKGEGKTITATNIASALAQQVDTRVLIIECDLRRPRVHSVLKLTPAPGLTNYLNDECPVGDIIQNTSVENLKAVAYGAIPPNPSELLASDAMKEFVNSVEKEFDFIIFDAPPVGVVIDAIPITKLADGVVIVVKNNSTTYPEFNRTIDVLKRANAKTIGVIVNRVKANDTRKGKYSNGYQYGYYGSEY